MTPQDITGDETREMINRREAILRVTALLGGVALIGGTAMLTGCREEPNTDTPFTADDVALLDEVAETILPATTTPGAKAAKTGALMAVIVTDSYGAADRKVFREGMRKLDDATRSAYKVTFMAATPAQRLAVLQGLDREQKAQADSRKEASQQRYKAMLTDQRTEAPSPSNAGAAAAITAEPPTHYFRMMKELALLGYFTSEIGCIQAQRYVEAPGRFEPCVPYRAGEKAWADHA